MFHRCRVSHPVTSYSLLYHIFPQSSMYSATGISLQPIFVQSTINIFTGNRSALHRSVIRLRIDGQPNSGGLSTHKCHFSGRFCSFRTACFTIFSLSFSPSRTSLGLNIRWSAFPFDVAGLCTIWYSHPGKHSDHYLLPVPELFSLEIFQHLVIRYQLMGVCCTLSFWSPFFECLNNCTMVLVIYHIIAFCP